MFFAKKLGKNGGFLPLKRCKNFMIFSFQVVTPSKIVTSNMASIQHEQLVESRKRSDIDFDAFSDVKRRKSEKGGKGTN